MVWTRLKKYARQIGSFPQGSGKKSRNMWNHQLGEFLGYFSYLKLMKSCEKMTDFDRFSHRPPPQKKTPGFPPWPPLHALDTCHYRPVPHSRPPTTLEASDLGTISRAGWTSWNLKTTYCFFGLIYINHTIHVWYIYLHLVVFIGKIW